MSEGKDFDALVNGSSNASAYQSGRDELSDVSENALDLERLAETLDCVPLNERLNAPKDIFLPEQLAEFERSALLRLKAYDEKIKKIAMSEIILSDQERSKQDLKALNVLMEPNIEETFDSDDDEEDINPNDIVAWLDKVLTK